MNRNKRAKLEARGRRVGTTAASFGGLSFPRTMTVSPTMWLAESSTPASWTN